MKFVFKPQHQNKAIKGKGNNVNNTLTTEMNSEEIFLTSCSVEYKTAQVAKVSVSPHIYSQLISLSHISFNLVSTNICSII